MMRDVEKWAILTWSAHGHEPVHNLEEAGTKKEEGVLYKKHRKVTLKKRFLKMQRSIQLRKMKYSPLNYFDAIEKR